MSLVLILLGIPLVSLALFNRVPVLARGTTATAGRPRLRLRLRPARLTEQGRALCTAVGGSALIVAFFLSLSGR
ncbi:hypothetical protein [Nocardiopsis sp. CNT312]|uniref:hypothetical protein n=1 Tax=Nocardiopsis sp. CNT312 TaxID=1137268 RepID=UPI00048AD90E|nr:hypothetical protein [Nocardiopsis sp. CNT312]